MSRLRLALVAGFLLSAPLALGCKEAHDQLRLDLTRAVPMFHPKAGGDMGRDLCANSPECVENVRELRQRLRDYDWESSCARGDAYTKMEAGQYLELTMDFEEEVSFFERLFGD